MAPQNPNVRRKRDPDPDKAYPDRVALRRKLDRITDFLGTTVILQGVALGLIIALGAYLIFR